VGVLNMQWCVLAHRLVSVNRLAGLVAVTAVTVAGLVAGAPQASADTVTSIRVTVTCSVPDGQPERQLARNSCLNYLWDETQTYTARVRDSNGDPVPDVVVEWTDSDPLDAHFRILQNPCVTGPDGTCSAELVDRQPFDGEEITVIATATALGFSDTGRGHLTFAPE
jgi:hypothetical protein